MTSLVPVTTTIMQQRCQICYVWIKCRASGCRARLWASVQQHVAWCHQSWALHNVPLQPGTTALSQRLPFYFPVCAWSICMALSILLLVFILAELRVSGSAMHSTRAMPLDCITVYTCCPISTMHGSQCMGSTGGDICVGVFSCCSLLGAFDGWYGNFRRSMTES